ncbi:MAG: DUF1570 domain-containing protein [Planctomycetes bacterium]|nr:DUF1570 domain-containing protein [Planctomycetota bacterium]MCW8136333.1 DUF1570 domain-containing protein [Planctomycetota bacterium]
MRLCLLTLLLLALPLAAQDLDKLTREVNEKYAALAADDVAGRHELAKWCAARKMRRSETRLYREIIKLAPDDAVARKALGHVQDNGVWYESEDAVQHARGKTRLLQGWGDAADGLKPAHDHWLTDEQLKQLEAGEALRAHKGRGWHEVLTREYRVYSELKESDTLDMARMLELAVRQWRAEIDKPYEAGKNWTLHVRILKSRDAYVAMIKDDIETFDQGLAKSHGFFDGRACWGGWFDSAYRTRRIFLHEARHQFDLLVAGTFRHMPAWYREGIAEFHSVHEWDGKALKMGVLNSKTNEHLHFLQRICKRKKLKGAEAQIQGGWEGDIDPEFYQQAWAFMYYLRTTHAEGFAKFEAELLAGKLDDPAKRLEAFKKHVAEDPKAFDKGYLDQTTKWADSYGG